MVVANKNFRRKFLLGHKRSLCPFLFIRDAPRSHSKIFIVNFRETAVQAGLLIINTNSAESSAETR
ncbi:hypothetical protein D7V82_17310 [bacterium 1xD8-6]|nr:hypothetical protein D7V72_16305 [bacterium D16-36]RKI65071.1 hypothetical protein D7V82_17310 [bacterium 1xD8-6]